ncbi:MAG TPA: hypothetical protein VMV10_08125 [Pirellulales bacterium]|nr:hypothetical protein [Pirellulales bacterium]
MAILYRFCVPIVVLCLPMAAARAEDGDDTLKYYLSRSSLVVSGELTSHPVAMGFEIGESQYSFKVKVAKVLKGNAPADLSARLARIELRRDAPAGLSFGLAHPELRRDDRLAWLKKGTHVIVFLRERDDVLGALRGADPWFAVQPASDTMERSLARLSDRTLVEADESGDDTLRHYISKSSLIISGTVSGDPLPRIKGKLTYQHVRLKTKKVLVGDQQGEEVEVDILQPDPKKPMVLLTNKSRVILFLTEADDFVETSGWVGADPWFGAQQYNSLMERAIERLAKD